MAAIAGTGVYEFQVNGRYGEGLRSDPRSDRRYDPRTGELRSVAYDSDGDLKPDSWAYFEHGRVVRMTVDADGDGVIDRAYTYDADGEAHTPAVRIEEK
jgi:hypothetical protein